MSGIRVTYSGLISFIIGLVGIFTGLIFTLIVTRTLATEEYGTWGLIQSLLYYAIMLEPMISFWVTREIAHGIKSGKTGIFSSGILSVVGISVYLIIAFLVGNQANVNKGILFFAFILIPVIFLNRTFSAINLGWKPHAASYGILALGLAQIPFALIFVYFLHMGITGVIFTSLLAYIVSIMVQLIYARHKINDKVKKEFLEKWLKLFWLSLYPGIANIFHVFDIVIFSIMTGSVVGIAYWSVSMIVSNVISNSAAIARAVYPKLLGENYDNHIKGNLTQVFYFGIFITALIVTFAKPSLFVLNPVYQIAVPVVILTSIYAFFGTLGGVFQLFITGKEEVDENEKSTFWDYVKSKLFFLPTLTFIQNGIYFSLLTIGLILLKNSTQIDLVIFWSIVALLTQIPFTVYLYLLARRNFGSLLDFTSILKYLLVSIGVFGMIYLLMGHFLEYNKNIFEFLPRLFMFIALGTSGYLFITYLVDSKTRKLFSAIIIEIRGNRI